MDKKYKLVPPSSEEEKAFNTDLIELAKKYSFNLEIVPQFKPNVENRSYEVVAMLLLQKIVEDTSETPIETGVPSTDPTVNPTL